MYPYCPYYKRCFLCLYGGIKFLLSKEFVKPAGIALVRFSSSLTFRVQNTESCINKRDAYYERGCGFN